MTGSDSEFGPGTFVVPFGESEGDRPTIHEELGIEVEPSARLEETAIKDRSVGVSIATTYKEARSQAIADFEQNFIRDLLECNDNNVSKAAKSAQMDRVYLHKLMRRHGIR